MLPDLVMDDTHELNDGVGWYLYLVLQNLQNFDDDWTDVLYELLDDLRLVIFAIGLERSNHLVDFFVEQFQIRSMEQDKIIVVLLRISFLGLQSIYPPNLHCFLHLLHTHQRITEKLECLSLDDDLDGAGRVCLYDFADHVHMKDRLADVLIITQPIKLIRVGPMRQLCTC